MKKPVKITISVTIYTDKDADVVAQAATKGILKELDTARLASPGNVKLERLYL